MSKTVDERVVSMQFDNKQFEKNVSTTMSTIDKLKQKLNLSGASKGLEDINSAAKKVDMSGLSEGVESVRLKFSALQVMGVTALANITNSALNASKNIVSALTINPIKDGFAEYETQMNAVQTILANTQKEGTNVEIVNRALDELNTYADKTIYNFTEMTRNIGTFTAAGVKLDTSVSAIKGIANLAAVSGSNSQQASTAMYQLSQAIAAGTVKLMDWNSVVNAGMGGQVFQDALIRTSENLQTGAKSAIEANGSFRESLQTGWLTTEVLTETLDQFSTAADTQQEYEEAVKKFIEKGYTQEEAKEMADMAKTAGDAATKVKTFTQLIDTLKEALGSGWTKTWQLVIGDFEEAKEMWTKVSDVLSGMVNKVSDARNALLESALGKGFTNLAEKLNGITEPAEKAIEAIDDLGDIVNKVIRGDFGNGKERFDALTEAGENYYRIQNKVNETLGDGYRYAEEQIKAQDELIGKTTEEASATKELSEEKKELIKKVANMTEEQMRSKGYTDEQIAAFNELRETANKLGMPLNDFIDQMDQITGRWLLMHSFENIGTSIISIFKAIGSAWKETFEPMSPDTLFDMIAAFHKFTQGIKVNGEETAKLKRTFKGLFAILDIITTIVGGGLKSGFKAVSAVLSAFDMDVLDLTASLGDMAVGFRDFLEDHDLVTKGFKLLGDGAKFAADGLKELYEYVKEIPKVKEFIEKIKDTDYSEIGKYIIDGLKNGLKDGITSVPQILIEIGKSLLSSIKNVLGIHSPSREMYDIGQYTIAGFVNGIRDGSIDVREEISKFGSKVLTWIKDFDWNKVFFFGVSVALHATVKKMVSIMDNITAPLSGLGDLLSGAGSVLSSTSEVIQKSTKNIKKILNSTAKVIKSFSKVLNAKAFQMKAEAIRNLAISLAILAGAVFLLAQLDSSQLTAAVVAISVLSGVLVALSVAMDKLTTASASIDKNGVNLKGLRSGLIAISVALLFIATSVKIMGGMEWPEIARGFVGLAVAVVAIAGVFASFGLLVKGKSEQNIDKAGKMIRKMAVTLSLMVGVCKLISFLSADDMIKGAEFAAGFVVFVAALNACSRLAGRNIDKLGKSILKISVALSLMVGVCKLASMLSIGEMGKGALFAAGFLVFVGALLIITKKCGDKEMIKLGGMLLSISASMILMTGVVKLVSRLTPGEMAKGVVFAAAFLLFVKALVKITTVGSKEQMVKVTGTVLAMSVAIGIMAGISILLGLISLPALAKGVAAVSVLSAMLSLMIYLLKGAKDAKSNIMAMSVAIAVMSVSVAALSSIDTTKLAGAAAAMSVLMGMFALIAKSSSGLKGSMSSLIVMTVAVGLIAGVLALLSTLPVESVLGASAGLSVLLLSLSASMLIVSKAGKIGPSALISLASMTLVIVALASVIYLLKDMNPESALPIAGSLSVLLLSMSACCLLLSAVGATGPAAFIGVGALITLITAVGALIVAIGALSDGFPKMEDFLNKGIPILEKIGYALGSFFGNIIGGFTAGATSGLPDMASNMSQFMVNIQPFIDGAKQIDDDSLSGVKSLVAMIALVSGANILETVASWLTGSSSIEAFGDQLVSFGDAIVRFSDKVSGKIDEGSVLAAAGAGKMMAEMQKSISPSGGVVQWFTGQKDLTLFGDQLVSFGDAIVRFSDKVSEGINEEAVTAAANAGTIMTEMQKSIVPSGGVVQWFSGENDMSVFGDQLVSFGDAIVRFSDKVSEGINEEAVKAASNAGEIMSTLQKKIVPTGGVVQWFTGEKDMSVFGDQITAFGRAITNFSSNTKVNEEAVTAAANAGLIMASLQNAIPEQHWLDGKATLDQFSVEIVDFGMGIKAYSDQVSGVNTGTITASLDAASGLIQLAKKVSDVDTSKASNFKDIGKIASAIKGYSEKIDGVNAGLIAASIESATDLVKIAKQVSSLDTTKIPNFQSVTGIGDSIRLYSEKVSTINTTAVSSSIDSANRLILLINEMSTLNAGGVSSFKKAVDALGTVNVDNLIKVFNDSTPKFSVAGSSILISLMNGFKSKESLLLSESNVMIVRMLNAITDKASSFNDAGIALMSRFVDGITSQKGNVIAAVTSSVTTAESSIRDHHSSFYSAGSYLVDGFISGISENISRAAMTAQAMATAAMTAARVTLGIHSPSRVFYGIGAYAGEGFANGLTSYESVLYTTGSSMGESAKNGLNDAVKKIQDIINCNIDPQPKIRPVLDLSGIKTGAGAIDDMLSSRISVGTMDNINAISTMTHQRNQNGANDDVVSAIDKLRNDLDKIGGTTYNIDGITYDDGSNISTAVEDLVRAAKIERRM